MYKFHNSYSHYRIHGTFDGHKIWQIGMLCKLLIWRKKTNLPNCQIKITVKCTTYTVTLL